MDQAKRLLQFPELPAQWFAHKPREIASRLVELHSVVARCQELWQGLAAFRREIVGTDFKTLATEVCDQSSPWLNRLRTAPPRTVRAQQEWFAALANELAEVRQLVGEIAVTVGDFSLALRVRVDKDSSLGLLSKLTALGSVLRQTGLLKPSWFDDQKRAELQTVAIKCQKQIDEANRLRNALSERMNAAAFDHDGESIAAAASAFEPFWTRIWCWITGDWGRFVRKSAILYSQPSSNSPTGLFGDILPNLFDARLLDDMSQLRALPLPH